MMYSSFLLIIGLVLLYLGGEILIRGSVFIAIKARISILVVGMTVVSFATSSPELFVSLEAIFSGSSDIVFGNIIGSNIANIALVLGLTAILFNINISSKTLKTDYPFLLFSTILVGFILSYYNVISRLTGVVFLLILSAFLYYMVTKSRKDDNVLANESDKENDNSIFKSISFLFFGILMLKFGADFLVSGAIDIANYFNVNERVIAVSVVAIGTSIPELVTSIIAALKKEVDLAVGNIVGSNIFNLLAVLGTTALFKDIRITDANILSIDYWFMFLLTIIFGALIYFLPKGILNRAKGALLFLIYIVYIYIIFK